MIPIISQEEKDSITTALTMIAKRPTARVTQARFRLRPVVAHPSGEARGSLPRS